MTGASIELDLLGTRFSIELPSARWSSFLRSHWHEFECEPRPGALIVVIAERDGETMLTLPGEIPLPFDDPWKLAEVLRYWLVEHAVQRVEGIVPFHAAALTKGSAAILCAGPSGAGKTTLAVALGHAGWSLASDDVAPIDAATGLVTPFPKPLSIRNPELWGYGVPPWEVEWPPPRSSPGPLLVPADYFRRRLEPFRPTLVFFIEYAPLAEPTVEPVPPGRAAALSIEFVRPGGAATVTALARLFRAAPAARLRYRNSDEAVAMIENSLANPQK